MSDKKATVLVVEDQEINQKILGKILENEYDVKRAENGLVALNMLGDYDFDAVVLDLVMPVMDGFQFMEKLKDTVYAEIPVIVITGEHNPEIEQKVFNLGAWDFIAKPVQAVTLLSRLENVIARSENSLMERLRFIYSHDRLTGLFNRNKMFEETEKMLKANPDMEFAFVRFDIDKFRLFNSAKGDKEGDKLLYNISKFFEKICEDIQPCIYGRIEGDVFCACCPYDKDLTIEKTTAIQKYMDGLYSDYILDASFGIYIIEKNDDNIESMLTKAAMATRKCKDLFQEHVAFYDEEMGNQVRREQEITNEMKSALDQGQFIPYFQPKYSLSNSKPCGAEALVRWIHPEKGIVSPNEFIPVFEKNGFIMSLDFYMWEEVCKYLAKWQKLGKRVAPVSVNVSRVSLYNPNLVDILILLVEKYGISRRLLNLEVTESAYMSNPTLLKNTIAKLRNKGFYILMDDFGSGYSSLNTLKEIEVDVLKIDMKFLPKGDDEEKSEKILSSIIRMAGWIGMSVIAEGVETLDQKQFLESIGCGYVQGFFFAKPLPVEEYERLMDLEIFPEELAEENNQDGRSHAAWSSDYKIEEILKSIALPVAIYEYSNNTIEVVRVNDAYSNEFKDHNDTSVRKFNLDYENEMKISQAFKDVKEFKRGMILQFSTEEPGQKKKWYQMNLRLIDENANSSLVCATFSNITEYKKSENRLQVLVESYDKKLVREKMLIVDDHEISRHVLVNLFEEQYEILEATNGVEALELLNENIDSLAIILTDMIMPKMDGEEFLNAKNKLNKAKNIPVVVISSDSEVNIQKRMLELGVNDYITKPFIIEKTRKRIENVLEYNNRFRALINEYRESVDTYNK